jgi:hypothetical protein
MKMKINKIPLKKIKEKSPRDDEVRVLLGSNCRK